MCHSTTPITVVLLATSDAPADQRSRNQRSHILLTTHHTINPNIAAPYTARFANPATACQNAVRCYAARAGASFRLSAAQHPDGPSNLLGPLSLVECKSLRSGGWCWAACCWSADDRSVIPVPHVPSSVA